MKMTAKVDKLMQIEEILNSTADIPISTENWKEQSDQVSLIREARLSIDRLDKEINKRLDTLRELSVFSKDILNKGFYSMSRIDKIIKHYLEKIIYHSNNLCEYLKESSGSKGRYNLNTIIEMEMIYLYFIDLYKYLDISNDSYCSSDESDKVDESKDESDESVDEAGYLSDFSHNSDHSDEIDDYSCFSDLLVRHYNLSDSDKDHELITEIWSDLGNPEFTDFDTFWNCYYKKVRRRVISQIKDEFYHILRDIVDYPRDNVITLNKLKRTALFGLDPVLLRFFTYDYGGILGHYSESIIRRMLTDQIRNGKKSIIFGIAGDRLLPVSIKKKKMNLIDNPLGPYRRELIEKLYTGSLKSSDIQEKIKSEKMLRELKVNINGTAYKLVPVKYNTDYLVTL